MAIKDLMNKASDVIGYAGEVPGKLALAIVLTVAIMAVSRPASAQTYGNISNRLTDKCLQPINGSTDAGAAIVLEPCTDRPLQQWTKISVKFPFVHFMNQLSGMCLDARGGARNQTPVQQWPCNSISNEYWSPQPDKYTVNTPIVFSGVAGSYPGFCLDVPGAQTNPGLQVQIYQCNGTAAQQWFTP